MGGIELFRGHIIRILLFFGRNEGVEVSSPMDRDKVFTIADVLDSKAWICQSNNDKKIQLEYTYDGLSGTSSSFLKTVPKIK